MRETFSLSRSMEYFTRDELVRQCGHSQSQWPILLLKELLDNALDACESALIQPKITVSVDNSGSSSSITVLGYALKWSGGSSHNIRSSATGPDSSIRLQRSR
jgi:hypothetical protein